jgi:chromosome segregation ATPase
MSERDWDRIRDLEAEVARLKAGNDPALLAQERVWRKVEADLQAEVERLREERDRYKAHTEGLTEERRDLRREIENERIREAARRVISVFMADTHLDDPDGHWEKAINALEDAAGFTQQGYGCNCPPTPDGGHVKPCRGTR